MKISKKVLIPVFATAMGLSVIGGIGGAVAWYQYNSKVTANFIGVSVTDKGVLQLSQDNITYTRAVEKTTDPKMDLKPVTFGDTADGVGSKQAWMYPESGAGVGYYGASTEHPNNPHWETATAGTDYVSFDLYFKAYENDSTEVGGKKYLAKSVYISDSFLRCLDSTTHAEDSDHLADQALRIQLDVEGGSSFIIGKAGGTTALSGGLDLDGSGSFDIYYDNPFITLPTGAVAGETVVYGVAGETQTVVGVDTYKTTELFKTNASGEAVHVKVTIWLEGWAFIQSKATWDPNKTAGCDVQAALEFSTEAA